MGSGAENVREKAQGRTDSALNGAPWNPVTMDMKIMNRCREESSDHRIQRARGTWEGFISSLFYAQRLGDQGETRSAGGKRGTRRVVLRKLKSTGSFLYGEIRDGAGESLRARAYP